MRPVELALLMIELLSAEQPAGVSALATRAAVPKTTAQRSLKALEALGWIEHDAPGSTAWCLTFRATLVTARPSPTETILRAAAIPVMEELRRSTEETIHLSTRLDASNVLIERLDGIKPVINFNARGQSAPLHLTASGKAILSILPPEEAEGLAISLLASGAEQSALLEELSIVRDLGFATTAHTFVEGISAVAAPVHGNGRIPHCALSISMPAKRGDDRMLASLGSTVARAARQIALGLAAIQ